MNIFTKKSFIKKIAILCLFLVLFNFSGFNQVQAANDDSNWGGKLLGSVISLFLALADGVYSVANKYIMSNNYFEALMGIGTTTGFWKGIAIAFIAAVRSSSWCNDRFIFCSTNCCRGNIYSRCLG